LLVWALLAFSAFPVPSADVHALTPEGHARNKQQAAEAHQANLKRWTNHPSMLVLPGLVADRNARRVEVKVERTRLGPGEPCEFTVIAETSDHGYEALLIAFAQPSDVHRALEFIGLKAGTPWNPAVNRYWARGERVLLSLVGSEGKRIRLEQLLSDRRTGRSLREEGFVFTGSSTLPAVGKDQARVYTADAYQPKAIVSLFNSAHCVLQVPYAAPKEEVYQTTILHPENSFPEGGLLSLILEPASPEGAPRVKDLTLRVASTKNPPADALEGPARLNALNFELRQGETVLNARTTLLSVLSELARLDRVHHDYFLTVTLADDLELSDAQGLAGILASIDSDRGVRIEPPPAGELHYRAFLPDPERLDREARMHAPWELSLAEKDGRLTGTLRRAESDGQAGRTNSAPEKLDTPVAGPEELRLLMEAGAARARVSRTQASPLTLQVLGAPTLRYGALRRFIAPALPAHPTILLR
jgi:hypothetical protein